MEPNGLSHITFLNEVKTIERRKNLLRDRDCNFVGAGLARQPVVTRREHH